MDDPGDGEQHTEAWKLRAQAVTIESLVDAARTTFPDVDLARLRGFLESLPTRYILDVESERVVVHHYKLVQAALADSDGLPLVDIIRVNAGSNTFTRDGSVEFGSSPVAAGSLSSCSPPALSLKERGRTSFSSLFTNPGLSAAAAGKLTPAFGGVSLGTLGEAGGGAGAPSVLHEFTFACKDRPGLLNEYTNSVSNFHGAPQDIVEAHTFPCTGGAGFTIMVTTGPEINVNDHVMYQGVLRKRVAQGRIKTPKVVNEQSTPFSQPCPGCKLPPVACGCSSSRDSSNEFLHSGKPMCHLAALNGLRDLLEWEIDPKRLVLEDVLADGSAFTTRLGTLYGSAVACKFLKGSADVDVDSKDVAPRHLERDLLNFAGEVGVLRRFRHKNVVSLMGVGRTGGGDWCYVQDYLPGGNAQRLFSQVKNPWNVQLCAALHCAKEVATGLVYLHASGIIHRDIKASNVLISEVGVVKISGFAAARRLPRDSSVGGSSSGDEGTTMTGETGTYRWMAPEVISHKPYTTKADVFSFGVFMWELFTGKVPYEERTPMETAVGVVRDGLRPQLPRDVPSAVRSVVERCWNADPASRPGAEELCTLLEMALKGMGGGEAHWAELVGQAVELQKTDLAMARHRIAKEQEMAGEGEGGGQHGGGGLLSRMLGSKEGMGGSAEGSSNSSGVSRGGSQRILSASKLRVKLKGVTPSILGGSGSVGSLFGSRASTPAPTS